MAIRYYQHVQYMSPLKQTQILLKKLETFWSKVCILLWLKENAKRLHRDYSDLHYGSKIYEIILYFNLSCCAYECRVVRIDHLLDDRGFITGKISPSVFCTMQIQYIGFV